MSNATARIATFPNYLSGEGVTTEAVSGVAVNWAVLNCAVLN